MDIWATYVNDVIITLEEYRRNVKISLDQVGS